MRLRGIFVLVPILAAVGCGEEKPSLPSPDSAKSSASSAPAKTEPTAPAKKAAVSPAAIEGDRLGSLAPTPVNPTVPQEPSIYRFAEIAKQSGVDFVHVSGMDDRKNFPTANGSGVAMFDYDKDGKLDLYFASASTLPLGTGKAGKNRLYRNLGDGKFQDVTDKAGVGFSGFCHGAIAGDMDNDGDHDLFLCNYGPNVLYKNNGNGTFTDVSAQFGVDRPVMYGRLEGDASADAKAPVVIEAVTGKNWKHAGNLGRTLNVKVAKGARIQFLQLDKDASHGVKFANPGDVVRLGEPEKPSAFLKEVGQGESRLGKVYPKNSGAPVVMAEFEVIKDITSPIRFVCAVYDRAWSSSGAFLDYDEDGDLDLYVSNYGEWLPPDDDLFCGDRMINVRLYCSPRSIRTTKHFLYRNDGSTFTEVSDEFLVDASGKNIPGRSDGHGFGIVAADLNDDGKVDLYVANDMNPNFLYLNKGKGVFVDVTDTSGAAYDDKGQAQSGMGVDAEDVTGDGLPEIFVTNFANEPNTLYQNHGGGNFMDSTAYFGLAADSMPWVGWGTALADFDNDGWPDSFVSNGHVDNNRKMLSQNVEYGERPLLHRNLEGKRFKIATRDVGPYFDALSVGRGAAFGDLDNDGDIDIVVNHKDAAPAILRNDTKTKNHWIRLELQGTKSNRDAIGAKVEVLIGKLKIVRHRKGGCSLMSTNDPRMLIGVGLPNLIEKITVKWPSGKTTELTDVQPDQTIRVVE